MSATDCQIVVAGPAYLDDVWRVVGSLVPSEAGVVLDRSVYELRRQDQPSDKLVIRSAGDEFIEVTAAGAMSLPLTGTIDIDRELVGGRPWRNRVGLAEHRRLPGGMGAGFAAALNATLLFPLGSSQDGSADADGAELLELLRESGVRSLPQNIAGAEVDTTLLISSSRFGDKLPIGRRQSGPKFSCDRAAVATLAGADVVVIAGVANSLTGRTMRAAGESFVVLASTWRNLSEGVDPIINVASRIDYLSCNQAEWEGLGRHALLCQRIALITVTAGTQGASVFFHDDGGLRRSLHVPAFLPHVPPIDTNHAGEAFASAFLKCLIDQGEVHVNKSGTYAASLIAQAAQEAAVAAHLQVQTADFHFAGREQVQNILRVAERSCKR